MIEVQEEWGIQKRSLIRHETVQSSRCRMITEKSVLTVYFSLSQSRVFTIDKRRNLAAVLQHKIVYLYFQELTKRPH